MPATAAANSLTANEVGVVVIGRNEGERLRRCLTAIAGSGAMTVYVDSGSSDQSVELARSMNVEIVELDMSRPFTAGRARNEGFARLLAINGGVEFVQFVDGDCELSAEWLSRALAEMRSSR